MSVSESASSDAVMVGDAGITSALKYDSAGEPDGVKNLLSVAMISLLFIEREGDTRQGGIGSRNNDDEEVGEGVVMHDGAGRNMSRWMGSSPLSTAGQSGPLS